MTVKKKRQKRRVVMVQMVPMEQATRAFDIRFWGRVGAHGRFAAAWDMVCDLRKWRGLRGCQPRLRRSIAILKPRES